MTDQLTACQDCVWHRRDVDHNRAVPDAWYNFVCTHADTQQTHFDAMFGRFFTKSPNCQYVNQWGTCYHFEGKDD